MRVITGLLIVGGAVLCIARVAYTEDTVPAQPDATSTQPATAKPDREAELEAQVEKLKQENVRLRQRQADLVERETQWAAKVAELKRQLAHRAVVRVRPNVTAVPDRPAAPKGAIPREFNGETFYLIPL